MRVLGFVAVALVGFFCISLIPILAMNTGLMAGFPADEHLPTFRTFYFGGAGWVWALSTLAAISSFFIQSKRTRFWVLALPVILTLLYCIGALAYFNAL